MSSQVTGHMFQASEMIALGLIVLAAHLGGKVCRRLRLSEVTGQLLGGAMVGPFALHKLGVLAENQTLYDDVIKAFHFFVFVFLGLVAFGIGEELHLHRLRRVGRTALIIALVQGLVTWVFIASGFYFFTDTPFLEASLLGSIGIASAPAVTFVIMNQLRIEGRLRHILGGVVVLADLFEVLLFSFLLQFLVQKSQAGDGSPFVHVFEEIGFAVLLGGAIYLTLCILVRRDAASIEEDAERFAPPKDVAFLHRILAEHPSPSAEILLVVMGAVCLGTGIAYSQNWPFLITAIVAGFMVSNLHSHAIFDSLKIEQVTAIFNLGFFALVGANMSLDFGGGTAWLALLYIGTRLAGKLLGTWAGCRMVGEDRKVTACLPVLLLPQAGVGAVEAVYAGAVLKSVGNSCDVAGIILPAIVFFTMGGVYLVDRTLRKWRSWVPDEEKALQVQNVRSGAADAARRLLSFLNADLVNPDIAGANKNDLIANLVEIARNGTDQHIDRAQALQVLGEREKLAPTGFGNGIAIPHCRLMGLDQPVLVMAHHRAGVVFGGVDNEPCHLILLILSSARDPGEHLRLLAATAHVFGDEAIREELKKSESAEAMLEVLRKLSANT